MVNYGLSVVRAWKYIGEVVSLSSIYKRARAHKKRTDGAADTEAAAAALVSLGGSQSPQPPSSIAERASITPGVSAEKQCRKRKSPMEGSATITAATNAAYETLPGWVSADKTMDVMSKRRKRTPSQFNKDQFVENATTEFRDKKHNMWFKKATVQLFANRSGPNHGKRGCGSVSVAKEFNLHLSSPNDKQITKTAIANALDRGEVGMSPPKRGRPRRVPKEFTSSLAKHVVMMQACGEAEASRPTMLATARALTDRTKWEGKFNTNYALRKTLRDHPAILNPVMAKNNEDRRVDWLTFKNINDWTLDLCRCLGML